MKNNTREEVQRLGAQPAPSRVEAERAALRKTMLLGLIVVGVVVLAGVLATAFNLHLH